MDDSNWHSSLPRKLAGLTFEGVPFQIALSSDEPFSYGGSAELYKGVIVGNEQRVVAVKLFRDLGMIGREVQEQLLNHELCAARRVSARHESILPFLGTVYAGRRVGIVSLYMWRGNLMQFIKSGRAWDKKALILQVAEAVKHLHCVVKLVHGDLKCENVLVSACGDVVLADFGLSRFLDVVQSVQATATGVRRMYTTRFAAPELLDSEEDDRDRPPSKTRESDVYAFGMLILEAVTEKPPWSDVLPKSMRRDVLELTVINRVLGGEHPPQPTSPTGFVSISHHWWEICKSCWAREPSHRPDMPRILDALENTSLEPYRVLFGHSRRVNSVAYLPGGRRVVSASLDGTIRIWDSLTGRTVVGPLRGHEGFLYSVAFSPDGRRLCAGGDDRIIRRWDAESGAPIGKPMMGHADSINSVAISSDGTRIASRSNDQMVRLWDATTGDPLGVPLTCHPDGVRAIALSCDGTCIASGSFNGKISLWDSTTGADLGVLQHEGSTVLSLCFSPDRIHLVSGSRDKIVRIWNLSTLQLEHELTGHCAWVHSVAVSPSGRYIASGSDDWTIRIWNADTGDAVGSPLVEHNSWVLSVAFSPDGRSIVSGSNDRRVRIWDLFM